VHEKELPVLIHCAGSDGFPAAARMWKVEYDTRCVLSHGCFDAHATAPWIVATGAPVNAGPRTMDYFTTHDGAITGTVEKYLAAGSKNLSLNTDSPVIPQEELFLQGTISARLGADAYTMLRACTIHPARVFGIDDRVGSLEPGKDADIVIRTGDPLDPRARIELVLIDGAVEYDATQGQWF
jgi:imidazolonepropionase-like amidohydrolase